MIDRSRGVHFPVALACYRVLVHAYPRTFRRRYGAELADLFLEERLARGAGLRSEAAFWRHIIRDLAVSMVRLRTRGRGRLHPSFRPEPGRKSNLMDSLVQDLRYAFRLLRQRPGFTAIAVLSLTLGIGANSLIYGLVDGLVLNPFSYPDGDRLVSVGVRFPKINGERTFVEALSPAEWYDLRQAKTLTKVAAFDLGNRNISGGDRPERVFTALVWGNPFDTLEMQPALGRGFLQDETTKPGSNVAVISHRIWQSRFGGDPALVGRTIYVNGQPTTLVGVMPPNLLLIGADLWIPMGVDPSVFPRNRRQFSILARLAPGASLDQANAELATIAARVAKTHVAEFKEYEGWQLEAATWADALVGEARQSAFVLLIAVAFVLLIACANIANMLLARTSARQTEIAVRLAMGCGRTRLFRQLLTESLLLSLLGALGGLALAYFGMKGAVSLLPAQLTAMDPHVGLSGRVLGYSLLVAMFAGVVIGFVPALQASGSDLLQSLKSDGRVGGTSRARRRVRHGFVVAQLALAMVLLVGAGLLSRSFMRIQEVDPGFNPSRILTMRLTLPPQKYEDKNSAFFRQLVDRVKELPGVTDAAATSQFPPEEMFDSQFELQGRLADKTEGLPNTLWTLTTPELFSTLGVPLRAGRPLTLGDKEGAPPVTVVNQTFARRYFPEGSPIGHRMRLPEFGEKSPWLEIVGVVADTHNQGLLADPAPEIFVALGQVASGWNQQFLLIRTQGDPMAMMPAVRRQLQQLDPDQPVYMIQTMDERFGTTLLQQRVAVLLIGIFAVVALVLASVGIYGVMSYTTSMRTQEIGIRMALGAGRATVVRMMIAQVARLILIGVVIGGGLSLVLGRAAARLLFRIRPEDPVTLVSVALLLGAVALLAGFMPAWRASRTDPITALRYQ